MVSSVVRVLSIVPVLVSGRVVVSYMGWVRSRGCSVLVLCWPMCGVGTTAASCLTTLICVGVRFRCRVLVWAVWLGISMWVTCAVGSWVWAPRYRLCLALVVPGTRFVISAMGIVVLL